MNVAIIGAGLAGLSCGIHLLNQGHKVHIYEKNERVGGRANRIDEYGYKIDMGPTLVLMPEILENLFRSVGKNRSDYIELQKLEPGYQINFSSGKRFEMTTDQNGILKQILSFAPDKEKEFSQYLSDVQDKFEYSRNTFIERNFNSLADMVSLKSFTSFLKIKPWGNAYNHVYRYFKNDYIAAALSCQALYLGQSPLKTPALYNLLAYLEFTYGIWYPKGGMHQIPLALAKVFEEMGGVLRLNTPVKKIHVENGSARGVVLENDTLELSDVVVSNRDLPGSYYNFVSKEKRTKTKDETIKKWNYGCSAFMTYLGVNKKVDGLKHHNILISDDFKGSAHQIFNEHRLPDEPQMYVCCPTKTDPTIAPEGKDIIYILSIVPNLEGSVDWDKDVPEFRKKIFKRLEDNGTKIEESDIELEKTFSPKDFESVYGTFHGTAFGLAPDFFQSAAFRPSIRSKDIDSLYHVGMSTHPGGGIPMVLTCGRLAAEQIFTDQLSSN